jgi:hypothetical protein
MKHLILISFSLILFTSCTKDTIKISDTGRKITINGLITTDSLLTIRIGKSSYLCNAYSYSYDSLCSIDYAKVLFYQNNNIIDSLYFDSIWVFKNLFDYMYIHGNYLSRKVLPSSGKEYKILAKAPGLPDASSTTTIPDLVKIERMDTSRIIVSDLKLGRESNTRFICNIEFTDPGNETNYYLFNIYKRYKEYDISYSENIAFFCNDPIVEEKLVSGRNNSELTGTLSGIAFTDKLINGQRTNFIFTIGCCNIGLPFWSDDSDIDEDGNHRKVIYFRLYSITEDYFKYIQTLNQYYKNYDNPLSDPVQVYSNVTGGYGIFAGAAVSSDSLVFTY